MDQVASLLINSLSYSLVLFMLASGLTLVYSMLGVLNFAHGALYLLGGYIGYSLAGHYGFAAALLGAPVLVGALAAGFERTVLQRVYAQGHMAELLVTFGCGLVVVETIALVWGRSPLDFVAPTALQGSGWMLGDAQVSPYRLFALLLAVVVALGGWAVWRYTRLGWVLRAVQHQPQALEALGYNVGAIRSVVFASGAALGALAGVVAAPMWVLELSMAASVSALVFIVVVAGGLGSWAGSFWACLAVGTLQTALASSTWGWTQAGKQWQLAQLAPLSPYLVLIVALLARSKNKR